MPKENIYGEGQTPDWSPRVEVGWTNDLALTIGIDREEPFRYVDPDRNGKTDHTAIYLSLDRAGTNRLIRTLRKARDAAFGRDE